MEKVAKKNARLSVAAYNEIVGRRKLFYITFFVVVLARAFTWHSITWIPYTPIFLAFLAFWSFLMIVDNGHKRITLRNPSIFIMIMLAFYYIIWGFYNLSDVPGSDAIELMYRSLMSLWFIAVCYYWIKRLHCLSGTIRTTYFALASLMLVSFIFSLGEISLYKTFTSFWQRYDTDRYRVLFGFAYNNIAAEYSMSTILLSCYMINNIRKNDINRRPKILAYLLVDLIMFIIICANNSRGTFVSFFIVMFLYFLFHLGRKHELKKTFTKLFLVLLVALVFLISYIISNNVDMVELLTLFNRVHFLDNIEAMRNGDKWIMGLGRMTGTYFREGHILYGTELNYMELFYAGVFVMTGIVGSIWIVILMLVIIHKLLQGRGSTGRWMLMVFAYMMLISFFEEYMFSASYITSTLFLLFVLIHISETKKRRVKYVYRYSGISKKQSNTEVLFSASSSSALSSSDDLISIVIPAYNAENYIKECLDSLISQTYKNIEIIVINDGSSDNTDAICREYAEKDPRIKYYKQDNSGVSVTRNNGVSYASGKYVVFVDSDDYCSDTLIENLAKKAREKEYDFVSSGIKLVSDRGIQEIYLGDNVLTLDRYVTNILHTYNINYLCGAPYAKMFKTSIIKDNNILFNSELNYAEDFVFNITYIQYCKSIATIRDCDYFYRLNVSNSLTFKNFNNSDINKFVNTRKLVYQTWETINDQLGYNYLKYKKVRKLYAVFSLDSANFICAHSDKKQAISLLRELCNNDYFKNRVKGVKLDSQKDRIKLLLLKHKMYKSYILLFNKTHKAK